LDLTGSIRDAPTSELEPYPTRRSSDLADDGQQAERDTKHEIGVLTRVTQAPADTGISPPLREDPHTRSEPILVVVGLFRRRRCAVWGTLGRRTGVGRAHGRGGRGLFLVQDRRHVGRQRGFLRLLAVPLLALGLPLDTCVG